MKLSKRLQQIEQMVTTNYVHIWDCCCDHGLLGANLLSKYPEANVHFVDIVPELMNELEHKLQQFYTSTNWQTHCIDVSTLPLAKHQGNHLVIIAGVGGDLMIEFIEAIYNKNALLNVDFLLCPVHHHFSLRKKLISLDFNLLDEALVEDNQRFYEIMLVSPTKKKLNAISLVGEKIWQAHSTDQASVVSKYLAKKLNHYQRIQQGKSSNVQHIIDAYHAINLKK